MQLIALEVLVCRGNWSLGYQLAGEKPHSGTMNGPWKSLKCTFVARGYLCGFSTAHLKKTMG